MDWVHDYVECDGCGQSPIIGKRYKCNNCRDYDLCQNCINTTNHDRSHSFAFIKGTNYKPIPKAATTSNSAPQVGGVAGGVTGEIHDAITCDGCDQSPIIGKRYKCNVCLNFDLCQNCINTADHDRSHTFTLKAGAIYVTRVEEVTQQLKSVNVTANSEKDKKDRNQLLAQIAKQQDEMKLLISENKKLSGDVLPSTIKELDELEARFKTVIAKIEKKREELNTVDTKACSICLEKDKCVAFFPCGHLCTCEACANNNSLKNCPICRSIIQNKLKIFS